MVYHRSVRLSYHTKSKPGKGFSAMSDNILQLNEADTQKFKDDLSSQGSDSFEIEGIKFTLGEPIDAIGGAILKTADGDIEVNNTIEARLERFKSILRSEVAEILFK